MPLRWQGLRGMQCQHAVQTLIKCRTRHAVSHIINTLSGLLALLEEVQNFLHDRCSNVVMPHWRNLMMIWLKLEVNQL
jgi:hypothetical protein